MRNIIKELWYGNFYSNTGCRELTPLVKQLIGYIADQHDNLQSTLAEEQKEVLEKFDDCYDELTDINEREIFVYAFRLGSRIMLEEVKTTRKDRTFCVVFFRLRLFLRLWQHLFTPLEYFAQKFFVYP